MRKIIATSLFTLMFVSPHSFADDFKDAADKLCNKITMCITQEVSASDDLPPEMKQMVTIMAQKACASLYDQKDALKDNKHIKAAAACFNSAAEKSCDSLDKGLETPECKALNKLMEAELQ
jgi:hypothetical protein